MATLTSYGAYVPQYRAPLGEIQKFYGRPGRPRSRALATPGLDEDTLTMAFEAARDAVAGFVGAVSAREIVFTRNASEAINLVARTWGEANLRPGDEVLLTVMEHHSNLVPWQLLAQRTGCVLRHAGLTPTGELDLQDLRSQINGRTKLVSLVQVSNTLGCLNPIAEIAPLAHAAGALIAKAEDALPIGNDDHLGVLEVRIGENVLQAFAMRNAEKQPPRPAEQPAEVLATCTHRRRVYGRQQLLDVAREQRVEQRLVGVLQVAEEREALQLGGEPAQGREPSRHLLLQRGDGRRQQPMQLELGALFVGERRALVEQRIGQQVIAEQGRHHLGGLSASVAVS